LATWSKGLLKNAHSESFAQKP